MSSPITDTPDQHGFVMAGEQTLFLHHLAMFFMENHMYQVILRVSIPAAAMQTYVADRRQHPDTPYILGNLQTDLMTLPDIANGTVRSFAADIFRGLPNDPNKDTPLIHNVTTTVEQIVHYRHFDPNLGYPRLLSYLLFGAGGEAHLAHYLAQEPDFDHVLDLAAAPDWLAPSQLEAGIQIDFVGLPNRPATPSQTYCSSPLTQPSYQVMYEGGPNTYDVQIGTSYWFETNIINATDPCAATEDAHHVRHHARTFLGRR
ncbi:MAG TPA: hypothetical protein VJU82_01715 [Acidobacteriaceae bacterium]|nr:hypothetical protein [Acidobacteriaceae bacterium]